MFSTSSFGISQLLLWCYRCLSYFFLWQNNIFSWISNETWASPCCLSSVFVSFSFLWKRLGFPVLWHLAPWRRLTQSPRQHLHRLQGHFNLSQSDNSVHQRRNRSAVQALQRHSPHRQRWDPLDREPLLFVLGAVLRPNEVSGNRRRFLLLRKCKDTGVALRQWFHVWCGSFVCFSLQFGGKNLTLCWPTRLQGSCCTDLSQGPNGPNGSYGIVNGTIKDDPITAETRETYSFSGSPTECSKRINDPIFQTLSCSGV